jgi:hypothetical protein
VKAAVRHSTKVAALVALAALFPTQLRAVCACAAAIMLEALPLLIAAACAVKLLGARGGWLAGFLGCGCGARGSARSIPAAILTLAAFGPFVALARVFAGTLAATGDHSHEIDSAAELMRLLPAAIFAGVIAVCVPHAWIAALAPCAAFIAGAALGICASPCAIGGVALAASLKAASPAAAYGVLCTAGIIDVWSIIPRSSRAPGDAPTYGVLALTCAIAAAMHGAMLVHPRWTLPLAAAALACAVQMRSGTPRNRGLQIVAAALCVATIIGAPVPPPQSNVTTLADAYAGERLSFTGVARERSLTRYAITCCRADAQPMILTIDRAPQPGSWYRASGTLEVYRGLLRMRVERLVPVAPPTDPFVYL